jgi:RimJ/RimL family protein N-acetyltransferase
MTTKLIYGEEERLLPWACERIGIRSFRKDAQAIGLERDGKLVAVVVYDTFSSCDCSMHVASDGSGKWLTRAFLRAAFLHPFVQWGYRRVTSPIAESNEKAIRFNKHLGFQQEGYHPYGAPDGALVTLGLLRENCRYLTIRPGKEYEKSKHSSV